MIFHSQKGLFLKIAILGSRGIPANYGGFETFADQLSTRMVELGVDVTVYCEGKSGPDQYKGVKLEYVPAPDLGPLTTILFDLRCLWHARKRFDVVYMLGYGASVFCFIPRLWGTEVWINMDGIEWKRSKWSRIAKMWFKIMEKLAMLTPNRILVDAREVIEHLKRRHSNIPPYNVIPYGAPLCENRADPSVLHEWKLEEKKYFLVVCRLEPENQVLEIMEGFLRSDTVYPLVIVGENSNEIPYARKLMQAANYRVKFVGTVYEREKLTALRYYSSAYFHGHSVGGTNPSLLEAMGCGNMIVAHDNLFNKEVAGDFAFFFDTGKEIPDIIGKIEQLTESEREKLSRIARRTIANRYSWEMIVESYLSLLNGDKVEDVVVSKVA